MDNDEPFELAIHSLDGVDHRHPAVLKDDKPFDDPHIVIYS